MHNATSKIQPRLELIHELVNSNYEEQKQQVVVLKVEIERLQKIIEKGKDEFC